MNRQSQPTSSVNSYLKACAATAGLTKDYNLERIDPELLGRADKEAKSDAELNGLLSSFQNCLKRKKGPDDVEASKQAFELFGEVKAYRHLKQFGYSPKVVRTAKSKGEHRPDLRCATPEGKEFFVEVKSFDIVKGVHTHAEILADGLNARIDIEAQQRDGRPIAMSEQIVSPYAEKTHKGSQVQVVIETIEDKFTRNFKRGQFEQEPTFALAVLDKLIIPGRQCALSPYYHTLNGCGSQCVSGALWAAAYAEPGYLLLDHYPFEGSPTNSGQWEKQGFFKTSTQHPAQALIMVHKSLSSQLVYGLINSGAASHDNWSSDDTEEVLSTICDAWNSELNDRGYQLANYDSTVNFPAAGPSKSAWDV